MFSNLTFEFINSSDFKEDSVRELIILPILNRLGYAAIGDAEVKRSKTLKHPFIRVGTTNHAVNIIPDYTLYFESQPLFVLDAKSPQQNILDPKHVQQAYSYAIHPEVKCREFGLCNGTHLAVFSVDSAEPILYLDFNHFEDKWDEIARILQPKHLLNPQIRGFHPDFGTKIARLGFKQEQLLVLTGVRLNSFCMLDEENLTIGTACNFLDRPHMVSFDMPVAMLDKIIKVLPAILRDEFVTALFKAPFYVYAGHHIEVDLKTRLGEIQSGHYDSFIPLIIEEVNSSKFVPIVEYGPPQDVPDYVYQLHKRFKIKTM